MMSQFNKQNNLQLRKGTVDISFVTIGYYGILASSVDSQIIVKSKSEKDLSNSTDGGGPATLSDVCDKFLGTKGGPFRGSQLVYIDLPQHSHQAPHQHP